MESSSVRSVIANNTEGFASDWSALSALRGQIPISDRINQNIYLSVGGPLFMHYYANGFTNADNFGNGVTDEKPW